MSRRRDTAAAPRATFHTTAAAPRVEQAQALAAALPPLLVAAERVAATIAQGLHGRRRVGTGESFWQFRPYVPGDPINRIDWRRSARSDQLHLRQTEWDAAQTVTLWRDASAGMRWRSAANVPEKCDRADVLLLALTSLLLRAGERVRLLDGPPGATTLRQIAAVLHTRPPPRTEPVETTEALPAALPPPHGQAVLFGSFLGDLAGLRHFLGSCAALPAGGQLVQVLDPAEASLPYTGRVRFVGLGAGPQVLVGRAEHIRAAYLARLRERQDELARLAAAAGFGLQIHHTDALPQTALLTLWERLAGVHRPIGPHSAAPVP